MKFIAKYDFKIEQNKKLIDELTYTPYKWLKKENHLVMHDLIESIDQGIKYQSRLNHDLDTLINETEISQEEIVKLLQQIDKLRNKYVHFFGANLEIIQTYNQHYRDTSWLTRIRFHGLENQAKEQIIECLQILAKELPSFNLYFQKITELVAIQLKIEQA